MLSKVKIFHWARTTTLAESWHDVIRDKAIPLQAWSGPEGSSRLRLADFKTVSS